MHDDDELILVKLRIHKSQYPELHHSIANVDKRKRATIIKRLAETGAAVTTGRLAISMPMASPTFKKEQELVQTYDKKADTLNIDDFQISFDPESLTQSS